MPHGHHHHKPTPTPTPTPTPVSGTTQTGVYITLYGWPDNDPPGGAIAYPDLHQTAGGTGTYADPITFASDVREIPAGTRIYIPVYEKYFIMEDECVAAESDWSKSKKWHVDLWIGGEGVNSSTVLAKEDALTINSGTIIINPANNLAVNSTPLLNV